MNHITLKNMQISACKAELRDLIIYLTSEKFQGVDADYVHIRTDLLPKVQKALLMLLATDPEVILGYNPVFNHLSDSNGI